MGEHFILKRLEFNSLDLLRLHDLVEIYAFEEVRKKGGKLYALVYLSKVGKEVITHLGVVIEKRVCKFVIAVSQVQHKCYGDTDTFSIIQLAVENMMVEFASKGLSDMKSEPLHHGVGYSGAVPLNT
jgi:hypothetical protein